MNSVATPGIPKGSMSEELRQTVVSSSPSLKAQLQSCLDAGIDRALEEHRIVGTVVLVAHGGEPVYSRAAGLADREARVPMKEESIFLFASVTKPIVTAAAMRLIEEGRVGLEDAVTRWLPDFRPRLPNGVIPTITVRHLLTHTAGLNYRSFEPGDSPYHSLEISDGLDQPGLSLTENLRRLVEAPLVYEPGSAWRYSLATDVLGAVIAEATEKPLQEAVRDLITGPLGMKDTDFTVVDRGRLATSYADGTPEPVRMTDGMAVSLLGAPVIFAPTRLFNRSSYPSGGAGMAGTARDALRFFEAIRTGGDGALRASTVERMMATHVGPWAQTWGPGWGFGLGWAVLDDPTLAGTPQSKGTIQWGGVYGHTWFVDRANALSAVVLTNTAFEGMSGAFPIDIRNAIYNALQG
jgi:CubicO group peptidase (beta-lactamase class C family)